MISPKILKQIVPNWKKLLFVTDWKGCAWVDNEIHFLWPNNTVYTKQASHMFLENSAPPEGKKHQISKHKFLFDKAYELWYFSRREEWYYFVKPLWGRWAFYVCSIPRNCLLHSHISMYACWGLAQTGSEFALSHGNGTWYIFSPWRYLLCESFAFHEVTEGKAFPPLLGNWRVWLQRRCESFFIHKARCLFLSLFPRGVLKRSLFSFRLALLFSHPRFRLTLY